MSEHEPPIQRELGVSDLDEVKVNALCNNIAHMMGKELGTQPDAIHVMGSFARGEAMDTASDLDLRIVAYSDSDGVEAFEQRIKNEWGPKWRPDKCGYIDAKITPLEPPEAEPSVEVWP